jgi:hypothetical protein
MLDCLHSTSEIFCSKAVAVLVFLVRAISPPQLCLKCHFTAFAHVHRRHFFSATTADPRRMGAPTYLQQLRTATWRWYAFCWSTRQTYITQARCCALELHRLQVSGRISLCTYGSDHCCSSPAKRANHTELRLTELVIIVIRSIDCSTTLLEYISCTLGLSVV